jgi:hypothetical protein
MPGQPAHAHARFRFPPAIHPRELPGCHRLRRNRHSASLKSSYVFAEPTLGQSVASRNRKTSRACAEAVDDDTSLWNVEENRVSFHRV